MTEPEGERVPEWWLSIRASTGVGRLIGIVVIADVVVEVARWLLGRVLGPE